MEMVHGTPITNYCWKHHLDVSARLELFLPVCEAVQHAHQKAILHRDLKPSNILIAEVDGRPMAKVIDFGIAKVLGAAPPGQKASLLLTRENSVIGTPMYMSPEQAGAERDVDTRSDIYALGAILYEMLAGEPPLSPSRLRSTSWDEVLKIIREQEPSRPSTRVGERSTAASTEHTHAVTIDARKIQAQVRGDLDWICLKALDKDRERRYPTAAALGADISAHLQDAPVIARPPTVSYRFGRWLRRNRLLAASIGAVTLTILAATVTASVYYLRERNALERERATSEKLSREVLKLGQHQGFLTMLFDEFHDAAPHASAKVLDAARHRARSWASSLTPEAAVLNLHFLAQIWFQTGEKLKASELVEEAIAILEKGPGLPSQECTTLTGFSRILNKACKFDLSRRCAELALGKARLSGEERLLGGALSILAETCRDAGDLKTAELLLRELCELRRGQLLRGTKVGPPGGPFREMAENLDRQDRSDEAIPFARESVAAEDAYFGLKSPHGNRITARKVLLRVLENAGHADDAAKVAGELRQIESLASSPAQSNALMKILALADGHFAAGRLGEAEAAYASAHASLRDAYGQANYYIPRALRGLAAVCARRQRWDESIKHATEALAAAQRSNSLVEEMFSAALLLEVLRDSEKQETGETLLLENPAWTASPKVHPMVLLRVLRPARQILETLSLQSPSPARKNLLGKLTHQIAEAEEAASKLPRSSVPNKPSANGDNP